MTIIAFDVSKDELVGVRINKRAALEEQYALPNERGAIVPFLEKAQARYRRLTIASEATAEYHRTLALECLRIGIAFRLVNPLVTKQLTRVTIRKQKTDLSDAYLIAKSVLQGAGTLVSLSSFAPAKTILRTAGKLGIISGILLRMERHLRMAVPEDTETIEALTHLRREADKAEHILRAKGAETIDPRHSALLSSIPGIGATLMPVFMAELQPIERFHSQKAIVAYAGLDPRVKQSGVSLKRNTHLTKRGSPYLRRAAYIAASIAQRYDPDLKAHYLKKRSEGKRYREATIANARHILYRVYAVWKRGTPYVKKLPATISTPTA